jgi:Collagen triple helix repeat (20 copies)
VTLLITGKVAGLPGLQGPPGITGAIGIPGPKGDTGSQGPKGDTGSQGPNGNPGAIGPKGAQGPQGDKGPLGIEGPKGANGAQGPQGNTGSAGPQGNKGPVGDQGPVGDKGDTGAVGNSGPSGVSPISVQNNATLPIVNAGNFASFFSLTPLANRSYWLRITGFAYTNAAPASVIRFALNVNPSEYVAGTLQSRCFMQSSATAFVHQAYSALNNIMEMGIVPVGSANRIKFQCDYFFKVGTANAASGLQFYIYNDHASAIESIRLSGLVMVVSDIT